MTPLMRPNKALHPTVRPASLRSAGRPAGERQGVGLNRFAVGESGSRTVGGRSRSLIPRSPSVRARGLSAPDPCRLVPPRPRRTRAPRLLVARDLDLDADAIHRVGAPCPPVAPPRPAPRGGSSRRRTGSAPCRPPFSSRIPAKQGRDSNPYSESRAKSRSPTRFVQRPPIAPGCPAVGNLVVAAPWSRRAGRGAEAKVRAV